MRAEVFEVPGLFVQAEQGELIQWLRNAGSRPEPIFLHHGEAQASNALRVKLQDLGDWNVTVAEPNRTYSVPFRSSVLFTATASK